MKKLQKFTPRKSQLVKNAEKLNGKRDMRKKVVKSTSVGSDLKKRIVKRQQGGVASYINVEEPTVLYNNDNWIPVEDVFSDYNLPTQLNKTKEEPLPEAVKYTGTKEEIQKDESEKKPIKQNAFINGLRPIISDTLRNRGIDTKWTDYLVAQAALESGWGKSESGKFNLSGIKGKGTTRSTKEYINGKMINTKDSFKDYKNYEDWANQYINLLTNKRYGKAFSMSEQEFMPYIVKQGYATDPNYISKYNKVLNEVKKYEVGGKIQRFKDGGKKSSFLDYKKGIYNTVDPTTDIPNWFQAIGMGLASLIKGFSSNSTKRYTDKEPTANAAWAKRLGQPYNSKDLPSNKDGSVRLPLEKEQQIATDTNFIKKRINLNTQQLNSLRKQNEYHKSIPIFEQAIEWDTDYLDKLRHTYKTGEPVVVHEYQAWKDRKLINDGKMTSNTISPLNVLKNFTLQYNPKQNYVEYRDVYDFNGYNWAVPGEDFIIRGQLKPSK